MEKEEEHGYNYPPEENTSGILLVLIVLLAFVLYKGFQAKVEEDRLEEHKRVLTTGKAKP